MSQELILNWLNQLSESVKNRDIDSHMALVSRNVQVYGLPNQDDPVDYNGWLQRRRSEFSRNILDKLSYAKLKIKTITLRRVGFDVQETMQATDGKLITIEKNILLEQEDDQQWRVVEETIYNWKTG